MEENDVGWKKILCSSYIYSKTIRLYNFIGSCLLNVSKVKKYIY
jgi:hypothetical protein